MSIMSSKPRRLATGIAAIALAGLALTACGSNDSSPSTTSSAVSSGAPKPVASLPSVTGKSTAIKLDAGFAAALTSLKLTPGTVGTATLADGSISFPITGGNVTVFKKGEVSPYVIGQLQHIGSGLSLTAGSTKVELTNFNVDPGVSRVYGDVSVNGKVAVQSAFLFQLDGRTLQPLKTQGTDAILTGTKVEISPDAASLLDSTFKTEAVKAGLLVGIATITVATK